MTLWKKKADPRASGVDPLTITEINLSNRGISDVSAIFDWVGECKNLKKLNLSGNSISWFRGLAGLTKLMELDLSRNRISDINTGGLLGLTGLINLDLSNNLIESIAGLSELTSLRYLCLNGNLIKKIERLSHLTKLYILMLYGNRITNIEGVSELTSLKYLDLSSNRISKIDGLSTLGNSLNILNLSINQIQRIEGLTELTSLLNLKLSNNSINSIEGLSNLRSLRRLDISRNQITYVPNILIYSPRLETFDFLGNPIERWHPVPRAFVTRIVSTLRTETAAVYSDSQSVHTVSVQSCIRRNIVKLLETDRLEPFGNISAVTESILVDPGLPEAAKKALVEYSSDAVNEVISLPGVRFSDILIPVWNRITKSAGIASEVKAVLAVEMADAECVCFTGRVSRLVNCLTGFFPDLVVEISKSEQIANIVLLARQKISESSEGYSRETHVNLVTTEMTERGYTTEEIEEWTAAIE